MGPGDIPMYVNSKCTVRQRRKYNVCKYNILEARDKGTSLLVVLRSLHEIVGHSIVNNMKTFLILLRNKKGSLAQQ